MKKTTALIVGIMLLGIAGPAKAWWDAGHMLVASIAYERLNPTAKAHCDELVKVLQRDYPYTNHFLAAATWPDDLKGEGVHAYDAWHYTNIPYNPDHISLGKSPEVNVVWAINNCQSTLRRSSARPVEKARALGFLIHCVGDIHQPLHSTSMHSNACPGGDLGGNKYDIKDSHRHLHQLWDDACGLTSDLNDVNPYGEDREALTDGEMNRIKEMGVDLTETYPENSFAELDELDPDFWALESHKLAVKFGYHGSNGQLNGRNLHLEPGGKPSKHYIAQGQRISGQQIALGGYRLSRLINGIWPD